VKSLKRVSRAFEVLTFAAILLLSPASAVEAWPLGIAPGLWLRSWLTYVALFIALALVIAGVGLGAAWSAWSKAERVQVGKPEEQEH
jgi:hypothetical protein